MDFKIWLENFGDDLFKSQGVWLIRFADIKYDTIEGYYADLNKAIHYVNLDKASIGDKVADTQPNITPYWIIENIDEVKKIIYLKPIPPNPFAPNAQGQVIGAGKHIFNQHDFDVLSGEYEKQRVDTILQLWRKGQAHDIRDIAYLLLGTVPLQVGPNGSQGGWYAVTDRNNRGHLKGMLAQDVMIKDAQTLQNTFKLAVPKKALTGQLDLKKWNDFVNGQELDDQDDTLTPDENFQSLDAIIRNILTNRQPYIKIRNSKRLIDLFTGHQKYLDIRRDIKTKINKLDSETEIEKLYDDISAIGAAAREGKFKQSQLENLVKNTAIQLAQVFLNAKTDPYWYAKEMFINLAKQENWQDVLDAYAKSPDPTNRRYVALAFYQTKQFHKLVNMLKQETRSEPMNEILGSLAKLSASYESEFIKILQWVADNQSKLANMAKETYYGDELKIHLARYADMLNLFNKHGVLQTVGYFI